MNSLQNQLCNYTETNWIDFYILLGKLSKSLRDKNKVHEIETNLIVCIHDVFCFAKQNDIDMSSSWNRWRHKMEYKIYN